MTGGSGESDFNPAREFGFEDESWLGRLRAAASASQADPPLGAVDNYELIERVGQGGQGTVYRARQPGTGRLVAIKRVRLGRMDDRSLARFRREIELAAGLRHPGIVTVHELMDQDRALVMEWIDGRSLDAWADEVRGRPDGLRTIVQCVRATCAAVAHAHGRGVIHRDLKPSNILVDSGGLPKVLDLGLARDATKEEATLTIQGAFAGTPVYSPPEQIDDGLHAADVRGDVYAIGAVLYRAITGREPFEAPTLAGLFDLIRVGRVTAPREHNPRIDAELESIVQMAMRQDRALRYATASDLGDDLDRWLERKAVRAHPPSTIYMARAFVRRHRLGVGLAAGAMLLIAGAGVVAGILAWRLNQQRIELTKAVGERDGALAEATTQRDAALLESRSSSSANHFLAGLMMNLADTSPVVKEAVLEVFRNKATELGRSRMRPEIDARLRITIGRTLRALGDLPGAETQAKHVIELAGKHKLATGDVEQAEGLIMAIMVEAGRYAEVADTLLATRAAPGPDGTFGKHELMTTDDYLIESLAKSGRANIAQRYLDSLQPPRGYAPQTAGMIASPYRKLCETLGLKAPAWIAEAVAPPTAATPR